MKRILISVIAASLFIASSCKQGKEEKEEEPVFLVTNPVIKDTMFYKEYVCQIQASNHIELRSQEKGYLQKIYVDEGQFVRQGQLMFKIMPAIYQADVEKARAKKASALRYLSSVEGRNFTVTQIVAEIASTYYELTALDNLLQMINQNIELQSNALTLVKLEKDAAKVTQLAVNRFEAQLLYTKNLQYEVRQSIVEAENRIHLLTGRYPREIPRNASGFNTMTPDPILAGVPSQLLNNRPDIRQAELELAASKLDVQVARANFYPSFSLRAGLGFQSFNPLYLIRPESIIYNLAGDLVAPLINKNAIKATYLNANARQVQSAYHYERTILNAHLDVVNQLSKMENYTKSLETKSREVSILTESVDISNKLFRSARADYIEVLLTQREALDSRIDLIEIRLKQLQAKVNLYRALGGGWLN